MKIIFTLLFTVLTTTVSFAQSAKVVVNSDGVAVGRYVRANAHTYTVIQQDTLEIEKDGLKVVTYSAKNGQGFVYADRPINVNVRSIPSVSGDIVGILYGSYYGKYDESYPPIPDVGECLGKNNGWYKIRMEDGKIGYVRHDLVTWDAIITF